MGAESDSSFYHPAERLGIYDATGDNVLHSNGLPIPIDVMIHRAGDDLHRQLFRLIVA